MSINFIAFAFNLFKKISYIKLHESIINKLQNLSTNMLTEKNIPLLASVLEEELFLVPDVAATQMEVRVFQLLLGQGIIVNKRIKQFGSASID